MSVTQLLDHQQQTLSAFCSVLLKLLVDHKMVRHRWRPEKSRLWMDICAFTPMILPLTTVISLWPWNFDHNGPCCINIWHVMRYIIHCNENSGHDYTRVPRRTGSNNITSCCSQTSETGYPASAQAMIFTITTLHRTAAERSIVLTVGPARKNAGTFVWQLPDLLDRLIRLCTSGDTQERY